MGPGTFTHNTAGVPIIVACTKADLIDDNTDLVGAGASGMGGMVKGKGGEWEERTDGIMQILRTICLKCAFALLHELPHFLILMVRRIADGASLFYTTPQPTTLNVLRQYALHVLFVPPAPAPDGALDSTAAPIRNPFPFVNKPNTLDRDRIVVPAGWDSWGKIAVLRDGFDAKAWGEAWERNLSSYSGIDSDDEAGARKLYASLVQDQGPKVRVPPDHFINPFLTPEHAADPASTPQQSDARTSLSREEPRRERAAGRSRPAWHLSHSLRRICAATRRPGRSLELVVLLTANGRARPGGDGGQ